jgi:ankyrin repeat protein
MYKRHKNSKFEVNPLHRAIKDKNDIFLTQLCMNGYDVNSKCHGYTPLYRACELENYKSAEILLKFGSDPNIEAARHNTLYYACILNNVKFVELLAKYSDFDLTIIDPYHGVSVMDYVVSNAHYPLIDILMNNCVKFHLNVINSLHKIVHNKNLLYLVKILDAVLLSNIKTDTLRDHENLLFDAIRSYWYEGFTVLLRAGLNPNIKNIKRHSLVDEWTIHYWHNNDSKINDNKSKRYEALMNIKHVIKRYNEGWSPQNNDLYPLVHKDIYNWLLLRHKLKTSNSIVIPKYISYLIIKFIVYNIYFKPDIIKTSVADNNLFD